WPAAPAGAVAVQVVAAQVTAVALFEPNRTVPFVNAVPVTVICVPPAEDPCVGDTWGMVGTAGGPKVNWACEVVADVPDAVLTVMSTVPSACAGATAVHAVEVHVVDFAFAVPKCTKPLSRFVPVIVTWSLPLCVPDAGATFVTTGAGWVTYVNLS